MSAVGVNEMPLMLVSLALPALVIVFAIRVVLGIVQLKRDVSAMREELELIGDKLDRLERISGGEQIPVELPPR